MSVGIALVRSLAIPLHRQSIVLRHALAYEIHDAEGPLSVGITLVGGLAMPPRGLSIVLRHALAGAIHVAEVKLSAGIALVGSLTIVLKRPCRHRPGYRQHKSQSQHFDAHRAYPVPDLVILY